MRIINGIVLNGIVLASRLITSIRTTSLIGTTSAFTTIAAINTTAMVESRSGTQYGCQAHNKLAAGHGQYFRITNASAADSAMNSAMEVTGSRHQ
jgi:hypothetical protein